jgi:hypothetical protein
MRGTGFRVRTRVRNGARVSSLYSAEQTPRARGSTPSVLGGEGWLPLYHVTALTRGFRKCFRCEDWVVIRAEGEVSWCNDSHMMERRILASHSVRPKPVFPFRLPFPLNTPTLSNTNLTSTRYGRHLRSPSNPHQAGSTRQIARGGRFCFTQVDALPRFQKGFPVV